MCSTFDNETVYMIYDVELKELSAVNVLSLRKTISAYDKEHELCHELGKFMSEAKIPCEQGGYSIYHDGDEKENNVDVEVAIPVKALGTSENNFTYRVLNKIPLAATIRFSGPYEGYSDASAKLAIWLEAKAMK